MKGYTNKTEIENYLLINIDESFWDQITRWITDIETYIDNKTGRNFIAESASAKLYDGDGSTTLLIDDCIEVTEVKIGTDDPLVKDESGLDDDYFIYPSNLLPKTKIRLVSGHFPSYPPQTVQITAKWGYSEEVPGDIQQIATVLVAGIINYSLNAEGEVKSMAIGRYNVTYKDEKQWQDFERVSEVFEYYKKYNL
jgi:hypothetical protein